MDAFSRAENPVVCIPEERFCRGIGKRQMNNQLREATGQLGLESVHRCPKCGHTVNLGETDLSVIGTGMITCPSCDWFGPVHIKIARANEDSSIG